MIQRKQTIYLFLAVVLSVVCLCLPLGSIELQSMGLEPVLYNLSLVIPHNNTASYDFSYCPLFVLLAIPTIIALVAIFLYRNRPLQARLCAFNLLFLLLWMLLLAYHKFFGFSAFKPCTFQQTLTSYLPFLAAVCNYLAFKGIRADERLVRAADRIR